VVVGAAAVNFLQDKTIKVPQAQQEPHKAETDKAEVVATEPEVVVGVAAKMVVQAADYLAVTTVDILGKTVTVWHQAAALYQLAVTEEYPMVLAPKVALLSAIIPKSFRLGI
jgi:hypothetical protein